MSRRWSVLVVEAPEGLEEEVAGALADQGLGAEIGFAPPGKSVPVRVYLDDGVDAPRWLERAREVLAAHGARIAGTRVEALEDAHWVERYRQALRPLPLGARFAVLPADDQEPLPGREPLILVPGMAFGTGEHPTTRLCAEALESAVEGGQSWLDLGTGTGILALIADRCGAGRVLAVDTDPEAIRVASEVVARNGGSGRIELREGSLDTRGGERFHGAVANIAASYFLREAETLSRCLLPAGLLLASGFLEDDMAEIEAALTGAGLAVEERRRSTPWGLLRARNASP